MGFIQKLDSLHLKIRSNRWYWLFSIFCRLGLAYAFIVAGLVKIVDLRFASGLAVTHPMGAYLEALHHTGYYYAFIGYAQVIAAILLLIPRTVALGAVLYFPIILNIWLLSYAVRFDGSYVTSPLMVLANLFLLVWHFDRLKYILPLKQFDLKPLVQKPEKWNNKFPFAFAAGVIAMVAITVLHALYGHDVMPRNSLKDCKKEFVGTPQEQQGFEFCSCIHEQGNDLDHCLEVFENSTD